jgi:c-di-GMP-binding flagellar brake protein YcgR
LEKRKFHRYLLSIDIDYTRENSKQKQKSKTKNVSVGGICITTNRGPLELNRIYTLTFKLPDSSQPILAKAKVVWSKANTGNGQELYDNGLEFINIKEKNRSVIADYSIGAVIEK